MWRIGQLGFLSLGLTVPQSLRLRADEVIQ